MVYERRRTAPDSRQDARRFSSCAGRVAYLFVAPTRIAGSCLRASSRPGARLTPPADQSYSDSAYQIVSTRRDFESRSSAVTSFVSSTIAVAAMIRSAGSPGTSDSSVPARCAMSAVTGSIWSSGRARMSRNHSSSGALSCSRSRRTAVAISNTLIAEMITGAWRTAVSIVRFARGDSPAVPVTHHINAWVSSTITY